MRAAEPHPVKIPAQGLNALLRHGFSAVAVFGTRFVVKEWLYLADSTTWPAVAKIAMGTPLTVPAAPAVLWAFQRTTKRLGK